MKHDDDRIWKAEDLLGTVVSVADDGTSTAERIARYFDRLEEGPLPARYDPNGTTLADATDAGVHARTPDAAPLPDSPPMNIPNHELIRCLGAGGFGQVWLSKHTLTEHYRACKLIPEEKSVELEGLKHLKQRVPSHPNLFPIEEVGQADGWLYCLMPLADAATTDQAVLDHSGYQPLTLELHLKRHGRRPTVQAASIGVQVTEAVRHLHGHGVTHGDIKPANIMRLGGVWTVADYGLARDLSSPSGDGHTPNYTPPEGPGSTKADQYAIGVVLMEMLVGWPSQMLADFRETQIDRFKLDTDGSQLFDIILRATEPDPDNRFGSLDELVEALSAIAKVHSLPDPEGVRRRGPAVVVLAAALVLIGVWILLSRPDAVTPPPQTAETSVPAAFEIESFEVRHYRYNSVDNTTIATGAISADNPAARPDDDVTIHAEFSEPAYFYLLSLDADGQVRAWMPESPTEPPVLTASVDFPCDPAVDPEGFLFNLSNGPGTQGFMLLASAEPLPAWADWVAAHGTPTWTRENLPSNVVVLFDGQETRTLSSTREPLPRRGRLILDPIDWAKAQQGVSARFIAFPVLPDLEN